MEAASRLDRSRVYRSLCDRTPAHALRQPQISHLKWASGVFAADEVFSQCNSTSACLGISNIHHAVVLHDDRTPVRYLSKWKRSGEGIEPRNLELCRQGFRFKRSELRCPNVGPAIAFFPHMSTREVTRRERRLLIGPGNADSFERAASSGLNGLRKQRAAVGS